MVTAPASAAAPGGEVTDITSKMLKAPDSGFTAGAEVYKANCAGCHDKGNARVPPMMVLRDMTPQAVHAALVDGVMRAMGAALSVEEKVAVSEFVTGRKFVAGGGPAGERMCQGRAARFDPREPPVFANWGLDPASTHEIPARSAGIGPGNVTRLKLKWAYGFPDSQRMRSQPALAGGAVILGSHSGEVRALDRRSGCLRWIYRADAEVRTAVIVAPWRKGDRKARPLAYFGDLRGNVHAIDIRDGSPVWKVRADKHPAAVMTGTPAFQAGMLYVPVSSLEEGSAASPGYVCCTFRGSVVALDAATGKEAWRTWLVDPAQPNGEANGSLGPSGVAVWNSPSIDVKRGRLYVATGDNYSNPATPLSDAIVALDLATGKIAWHYQATGGDAWNVACAFRVSGNCPQDEGPDFDFGAGTVLAQGSDGRERVMAGQKSGIVYALDPDSGALEWQARVGRGSAAGGVVFGMAASQGTLFVPVSDRTGDYESDYPQSPGLYGIDIASGKLVWGAPAPGDCAGKQGCTPGLGGTPSATPGLVFSGADDAVLRIHDAATGKVLWHDDTSRAFETINGVAAHGGAIGGGVAPLAYRGQLFVPSGYGFAGKMPGNVLLVYDVK